MQCPRFVDFTRECQYEIGVLPQDTRFYCATRRYRDCPFYKILNNIGHSCKFLKQCPAFEHFKTENFDEFVKIANDYCLSKENNASCSRYKIRIKGDMPSVDLLPDGSFNKR